MGSSKAEAAEKAPKPLAAAQVHNLSLYELFNFKF